MRNKLRIYPSLMASPLLHVGDVMGLLESTVDGWHLDVMDGHFVPNITFGPDFIRAVGGNTHKDVDVHLMVDHVEDWIHWLPPCVTHVAFHIEATRYPATLLQRFRHRGFKVGIAINPCTEIHALDQIITDVDSILLMCVQPGQSGQPFMPHMADRIAALDAWRGDRPIDLHVDGGIQHKTAPLCQKADVWVVGSGIFKEADPLQALTQLRRLRDKPSPC